MRFCCDLLLYCLFVVLVYLVLVDASRVVFPTARFVSDLFQIKNGFLMRSFKFTFPGTVAVSGDYENFVTTEATHYGYIDDEELYENP